MADYQIVPGDKAVPSGEICSVTTVRAGDAEYELADDGTVRRAVIGGNDILAGPGHDLHHLRDNGTVAGGPGRPGRMRLFSGSVGTVVRVSSPIDDLPVEIEFMASPVQPFLEIATRFDFNGNSIGVMWEDWTKLNAYWPVAGRNIRHDIPYGAVDGTEGLPLHAPNWIAVTGKQGGLAVFNTGTPKHFVEAGVIGCVLAWGGHQFSNRMHTAWWEHRNHYDLTLKGRQTIRSAAMALPPSASEADIVRSAQSLNSPLLVFAAPEKNAPKPLPISPDFSKTGLACSAVFDKDGRRIFRYHEVEGKTHSAAGIRSAFGQDILITDLCGNPLDEVTPYRIGHIIGKI